MIRATCHCKQGGEAALLLGINDFYHVLLTVFCVYLNKSKLYWLWSLMRKIPWFTQ